MFSSVNTVILLTLLPVLVKCTGESNIKLLEEEVAAALKTCVGSVGSDNSSPNPQRQKRFADNAPRIDDASKPEANQYSHERRNTSDLKEQIYVINSTDSNYDGYGSGNLGEKYVNSIPKVAGGYYPEDGSINRTRRSDPLFAKPDNDQCLSQCVFANLQVVDSRGIPREAELWNKIQSSVTSQQSRAVLKDQISACFQGLQSEAEDNGCAYSNKLERCLMLRFSDRKPAGAQANDKSQGAKSDR